MELRVKRKKVQKMMRDGLMEQDLSAGEQRETSSRQSAVFFEKTANAEIREPLVEQARSPTKQRKYYQRSERKEPHFTGKSGTNKEHGQKIRPYNQPHTRKKYVSKATLAGVEMGYRLGSSMCENMMDDEQEATTQAGEPVKEVVYGMEKAAHASNTGRECHYGKSLRASNYQGQRASEQPMGSGQRAWKGHANQQKQRIKREYQKLYRTVNRESIVNGKTTEIVRHIWKRTVSVVQSHAGVLTTVLLCFLIFLVVSSALTSCGTIFMVGVGELSSSSYLSSDEAIKNVEKRYCQLEDDLQERVNTIERTYPGYDEYRYNIDAIEHDPYVLTSYFTVKYGNYKEPDVDEELQQLFDMQYKLTVTKRVETRKRDDDSEYKYYILNVKLVNKGLDTVIQQFLADEQQKNQYAIYQAAKGNRAYLFEGLVDDADYEVPAEALEDEEFRKMIAEAEKFLGYPYVWGGSSPATSFDCSGFVSWVINHSVGNVGRETANGLLKRCQRISSAEAKPGDLIFFQGTYNTTGASHVGIYVGNNTMIHCGNPIKYANIESAYWKKHFYCFGRLK